MMALWSRDELARARQMNRRQQAVDTIARATGHTVREVHLALWHLLGREPEDACDALNLAQIEHAALLQGQGGGGANNPAVVAR